MELDNYWLMTASLVTSSVIAIITNLFLLLIFIRRRSLRTVPNRFIVNLLLTNLLSSIILIPLLILDQRYYNNKNDNSATNNNNKTLKLIFEEEIITNHNVEIIESKITESLFMRNTTNNFLCYFAQSSINFMCTLSILSILLIGVNQYFGVLHSLRYHFYINKCRSMLLIIITWLIALIFCLLKILTVNSKNWCFCHYFDNQVNRLFNTIYAFTYFTVIILAPFVAICVIYMCIYTAAHKNSERMRKSTSTNLEFIDDKTVLPEQTFLDNDVKWNLLKTIKLKLTNSLFRYREETRAAKISVLVIFLVLFCYIPYGIMLVLNSQLIQPTKFYNYLSLILLVVSNVISPFLFAYRNTRVKREIAKIFRILPDKQQQTQQPLMKRLPCNIETTQPECNQEFLVPEVIVTCNNNKDIDRKSILKRVCDTTTHWTSKKCNFIVIPNGCINTEARGSFSSASTQISTED